MLFVISNPAWNGISKEEVQKYRVNCKPLFSTKVGSKKLIMTNWAILLKMILLKTPAQDWFHSSLNNIMLMLGAKPSLLTDSRPINHGKIYHHKKRETLGQWHLDRTTLYVQVEQRWILGKTQIARPPDCHTSSGRRWSLGSSLKVILLCCLPELRKSA